MKGLAVGTCKLELRREQQNSEIWKVGSSLGTVSVGVRKTRIRFRWSKSESANANDMSHYSDIAVRTDWARSSSIIKKAVLWCVMLMYYTLR